MVSRHGRQVWHARSPGLAEVPGDNTLWLYVAVRNKQGIICLGDCMTPPHFLQTAYSTCQDVTTEIAPAPTWCYLAVTAKQQPDRALHLNLNSPGVLTTLTPKGGGVSGTSRPLKL